ncbi:hypothetical protein ABFX02_02G100200 [Erythranthe guttata]
MFDGVSSSSSEQFHQFMAARTTSSSSSLIANNYPLMSSFSNLHHHHQENPSSNFSAGFDNTYSSSSPSLVLHHHHNHHHHQESSPPNNNTTTKEDTDIDVDVDVDVKHVVIGSIDPWSDEEVLALLRLRSTMEIWFPDFTWLHISRKLSELGFKRSAEQCKDRFDQETKHLNTSTNVNFNKNNYRNILMSELDEFYPPADQEQPPVSPPKQIDQKLLYKNVNVELESEANLAPNPSQESEDAVIMTTTTKKPINKRRKKKRKDKFEIFKGFCQAVVNKMMAQQEDLHNKLIDDIVKRDKETIARDEARKNEEMERLKREMDVRAKEQAIARERQATLIEFLKKFTSQDDEDENIVNNEALNSFVTLSVLCPDKETAAAASSTTTTTTTTTTILAELPRQIYKTPSPVNIVHEERGGGDLGKRWPRDEVLALINLRCKLSGSSSSSNSNEDVEHGEMVSAAAKGIPLWERISQGMMELGYKRNAKRCKEKWENINKYFRKTKDSNKKRSINSRTCPYFQQLTSLYSQAGPVLLVGPPTNNIINNVPEN